MTELDEALSSQPSYDDVAGEEYKWSPPKIKRLWEEGKSAKDIEAELMCSTTTIYHWLHVYAKQGRLKNPPLPSTGPGRPQGSNNRSDV